MAALKLCSINVNGFRDKIKPKIILSRLLELHFDIVFLQETHITNIMESKKFTKLWKGKTIMSFGSNRSRGVGILFSSNLNFKLESFNYDFEGRVICADITLVNTKLRLINVYTPNIPSERRQFIKNLQAYLITSREIILGGDWNCIEDLSLDKMAGDEHRGTDGAKELLQLRNDFYLKDVFRVKYPKQRQFSYRKGPIHVRLDRFYMSDSLLPWIKDIKYTPCSISDHYYVDFTLQEIIRNKNQYGPGYWKCNVSILSDPDLCLEIEHVYNTEFKPDFIKDGNWWECCKRTFRKIIIKHSRLRSTKLKKEIKRLEEALRNFIWLSKSDDDFFGVYVLQIKQELNDLILQKLNGSFIRSRVQFIESYEKPTRFFLRTERQHIKNRTITELRIQDRSITDSPSIIEACRQFYQDLYTEEPVSQEAVNDFLYNINLPRVPPDLYEQCEGDLTFEEALDAIKLMKNGKTPGSDGLPAEFYKKFFHIFGHDFVTMINLCNFLGRLSPSQRLSLITLLCKNRDFHFFLNYWRPISLLNVDYKIVSKALSIRLRKVMPYIVHMDQTCSVIGRSITDNVHLLRNIFDFTEQKGIKCAFINLDQAKAFDRVSIPYLLSVLQAYGFGPSFLRWIGLLYTDIQSAVIVNGHISPVFPIERGVRQGCAISPLLYVLTMEPFAGKIRASPTFRGLNIPGNPHEARISQYADDTTLICTNLSSIQETLQLCTYFGTASGAQLNRDKTCGMWLGGWKYRQDKPYGISWVREKKMLGFVFTHNDIYKANWQPILEKFRKTLDLNSKRGLSLHGKAILANIMACSKLWYIAPVLYLPDHYLKRFNKALFQFIWDGVHEPIKRTTLIGRHRDGGLNVVSIKLKAEAFRILHIVKLLRSPVKDPPKWVFFTIYWVGLQLRKYRPDFATNSTLHCLEYRPQYYKFTKTAFDKYLETHMFVDIKKMTVKTIYEDLLDDTFTIPKVERDNPELNYNPSWSAVSNNFLDPEVRACTYRIAHRVLQTNVFLFNYTSQRFSHCTFCGRKYEETLHHLFIACIQASPVWGFVKEFFWKTCNHRLKISKDLGLYNIFDTALFPLPKGMYDVLLEIVNLAKYSIWVKRCEVKYEHLKFHKDSSLEKFISKLKFRIRVDHYRFRDNLDKFYELWGKNDVLFTHDSQNHITFHF